MQTMLRLKSHIVGTPLEPLAHQLRWIAGARQRAKHPELSGIHEEDRLLPEVLTRLLGPESCAVDVGAHIGSFLSLLYRLAPQGHHTAFEPSPQKAEWLRRKFKRADIIEAAVSDSAGNALFEENKDRPGFSRLVKAAGEHPSYEVPVLRLDDVITHHVDLLKLDIEGHEFAALRGARQLIESHQPAILFECGTEHDFARLGIDRNEMFRFICDELGYSIRTYQGFLDGGPPLTCDEFRACGEYPFKAFNFVSVKAQMKNGASF